MIDLFGDEEAADYVLTRPSGSASITAGRGLQHFGERARALAGPKEDSKLRELVEIPRGLLWEAVAERSARRSSR